MIKRMGSALLALAFLIIPIPGAAQSSIQATLSTIDTDSVPRISAYLDLRDERGEFISGQTATDLHVFEDDRLVPLSEFEELRPGVQFVVAINPDRSFAIRNAQGVSRFDFLRTALAAWVTAHLDSLDDDLSLLTTTGPEETHLTGGREWLATLEAYQSDFRSNTPSLDVLSRAINVAADPTQRPGMGRAILLITSPPDRDAGSALQSAAARAAQAGIRIFVWMVAPPDRFQSPGAQALQELADQTGGQLFPFSGEETIPDLEAYLNPLRSVYFLAYESQIITSGNHQLAVALGDDKTPVAEAIFELDIFPPNPVFVSPPTEIQRTVPEGYTELAADLTPKKQPLEILIEFPDGHPRTITSARLLVDGQVVAQNSTPPFDRFTWDLTDFVNTRRHLLRVEVQDQLGLQGSSFETPVQITIQIPEPNILTTVSHQGPLLAAAGALMAGAILLLVLILGGRIQPKPLHLPRSRRRAAEDPVTQPVETSPRPGSMTTAQRWTHFTSRLPRRLPWPQGKTDRQPLAYLARLPESDQAVPTSAIPINTPEITIGSDPKQATLCFRDPSVDGLHARLRLSGEGLIHLADQGSVAGTWINYAPISQEWAKLDNGDLIHFGRVGFRLITSRGAPMRQPKVIFKEDNR